MSRDRGALRVVCYAVNGTGVGHLTRLLSMARWLRRYAAAMGRKVPIAGLICAEGLLISSRTVGAE